MRSLLSVILLFIFAIAPGVSRADQSDPRLETWFSALPTARGAEALALQQLIWSAWYRVPEGADQAGFGAARRALGQGNLRPALAALEALLEAYPDYAEAHNQIAIVYFANGDDAQILEAIFATLALEPRHFGALGGLAQIYLRQGNYSGAIEAANAALAINPHMDGMAQLKAAAARELERESV